MFEVLKGMVKPEITIGIEEEYYQEIKVLFVEGAKITKIKDKINFQLTTKYLKKKLRRIFIERIIMMNGLAFILIYLMISFKNFFKKS